MAGKTLEERIRILEDIEEIKQLKAKFCNLMDMYGNFDVSEVFTEDAELDYRPLLAEKIVGIEAISALFDPDSVAQWERMVRHQLTNPIIEVDGDKAKGVWYMYGVATLIAPDKDIAIVEHLTYEDELRKENGKWKISRIKGLTAFISPYEDGWVKTPMFDLNSQVYGAGE